MYRLLTSAVLLPTHLGAQSARPTTAATTAVPAAVTPVAEGRIVDSTITIVPATIHGRTMNFVADLGEGMTVIRNAVLDQLGIPHTPTQSIEAWFAALSSGGGDAQPHFLVLDSVNVGPSVLHHVNVLAGSAAQFQGPEFRDVPDVAGLLGTNVLPHYDLEFDLPAKRLRMYAPRLGSHPGSTRPTWLPHGLTAADCTPGLVSTDESGAIEMDLQVRVNGHPIRSTFDNREPITQLNIPAGKLLGLRKRDLDANRMAHGITVQIGNRTLASVPILVVNNYTNAYPYIALAYNSFQDRLLFLSYSTGMTCVSLPRQP